jgi:tripartite-type tricarboxylate transporter receptor subunit TctC
MLRILVFRKGTPKAAIQAMRGAWEKTMADPDFQKDYKKANNSGLIGMTGPKAQKYIKRIINVRPELQKFLFEFSDRAKI